MDGQDWEPVVLKKRRDSKPKKNQVLDAQRKGDVEIRTKQKQATTVIIPRKLDDEESDFKHPEITQEFKVSLQKARVAKGLTQAQLAQKMNQPVKVINDYEAGRAVPQPHLISKFNRILGVQLPKIPKKKKTSDDF